MKHLLIFLRITEDNDFYHLDEGLTRLPYFIAGIFFILLILRLVENKK